MNFDYSEEQQLLADSVRRYLGKSYDFEARRKIVAGEGWSEEAWAQFAQMGLTGLPLPADFGGFGGGAVDLMGVMEAFGESLVVEPYVACVMAARLVARGAAKEKEAILQAVAEGALRLAFAHTEKGARYDLGAVSVAAARSGTAWRLDGVKSAVVGAPAAERLVVSARTPEGVRLFLVQASDARITRARGLDERLEGEVVFEATPAQPLEGGMELIEETVDFATALVCAEAAGVMKFACDTTLEYLKTRKQFGVPIGTFQALQHRMVDMVVSYEQAKSMACLACSRADQSQSPAERARAISAAKIRIGDAARHISQESVQLHGGMGMTDELKISHAFRRLTVIGREFGDADHHLARFASS